MKPEQKKQIITHGKNIKRIFNLPPDVDPLALCKKLRHIELKFDKLYTGYCNGSIDLPEVDMMETALALSLDNILHNSKCSIPIVYNRDPRGYALKIDDKYVRDNNLQIHRDLGGYGIIAPEIT